MNTKIKMRVPVRASLQEIEEYKPGKLVKGAIKLSSNENPLGPSPEVIREIVKRLEAGELNLNVYPWEKNEDELRDEISRYAGAGARIEKDNVVLGAGVDGVLDTLARIFIANGDEALIPIPTFSLYESLVKIAGGVPRYVKRKSGEDFSIPVKDLISLCNEKTKLIFISSPNNPTGNCIPEDEIREIIESVDSRAMVVIDEAYAEFADSSLVNLVTKYENVAVMRTFSKAFGLAGLRVGYGIIPEWLTSAKAFEKVLITATFSYFVTRFTSDESANSAYASSITTIALESTDSIISRISSSGMQFPVGLLGEEIKMSFVFSLHKEIKSLTGMLKSSPLFLFTYLGTPPAIFTSDS